MKKKKDKSTNKVPTAAEIEKLVLKGKYKIALNKAKIYNKNLQTKESEKLLIDVHIKRISQMVELGHLHDAKVLISVVKNNFLSEKERFEDLSNIIAVREGNIDDFVKPLVDPAVSDKKRKQIEDILKNELTNLNDLAICKSLPLDHPLKTGAALVMKAFETVTSGYTSEKEIALPAVSRKSLFAPWKMLIRAILFFYQKDDEKCQRCLNAIDSASAPYRLAVVIQSIISDNTNDISFHNSKRQINEKTKILTNKISGNMDKDSIKSAIINLDKAFNMKNQSKLLKAMKNAVKICEKDYPQILEKLKQHISIKAWMKDICYKKVVNAMGCPTKKNGYFLLLHARAAEISGKLLFACCLFYEFCCQAKQEGWFSDKGIEIAEIYCYITNILNRIDPEDIDQQRDEFIVVLKSGKKKFLYINYHNYIPAFQNNGLPNTDLFFLYPDILYKKATDINPCSDIFDMWIQWTFKNYSHWKNIDQVAILWHKALNEDTKPLLYLMESAEKRNAFTKALSYLEKAEQIDKLNPEVQRAKLRLFISITMRHLKQRKPHLARNDFEKIQQLPQSREGYKPAFLTALKLICSIIENNKLESSRQKNKLIKKIGNKISAAIIIEGLLKPCGIKSNTVFYLPSVKNIPDNKELVLAVARALRLGDSMGLCFSIPSRYIDIITNFFKNDKSTIEPFSIITIANSGLNDNYFELAYAASGNGLLQGGVNSGKLLLVRAKSLPLWAMKRKCDCITAVIEMARRQRDTDLLKEAIELRRTQKFSPFDFLGLPNFLDIPNQFDDTVDSEKILQIEKDTISYPNLNDDKDDLYDFFDNFLNFSDR